MTLTLLSLIVIQNMCFHGHKADLAHVTCLAVATQLRMNCFDNLFVPTDMVLFSIRFSSVQYMPHCQSDSRLWIQRVCAFTHELLAASSVPPSPPPSICMSNWISEMADAVEEHEAAQAPPQSKASMPGAYQDEVPTEPATSPRSQAHEVPVHPTYLEELRPPSREYGPQRDRYTREEWEAYFCERRQAWSNKDTETDRRQAEAAEHEAHERSIKEWEARVKARDLDNPDIPCGQGTSSMRALPNVHEALRQNDPRMASFSQPAVKKAPPSSGRPMPSVFQSDAEPPRIGAPVQPPPPAAPGPADAQSVRLPLAATPMTPSHPPRPPIAALPKYPSMETSQCANKHALEPPTAQAPPSKQVKSKAFPYPSSSPPDQVFMAASAAVDMPQPSGPCPKGPPSEYMPTPPELMSMQKGVLTDDQKSRMNDQGKYLRVKSVLDIDWSRPLCEQLAPVLKGGPDPTKSQDDLRALCARVPELTNQLLEGILPADNVITVVQKSHDVHKIHMREVAAWHTLVQPLTATHHGHCMVPQLGRCKQVPVLDAGIASSLW